MYTLTLQCHGEEEEDLTPEYPTIHAALEEAIKFLPFLKPGCSVRVVDRAVKPAAIVGELWAARYKEG